MPKNKKSGSAMSALRRRPKSKTKSTGMKSGKKTKGKAPRKK